MWSGGPHALARSGSPLFWGRYLDSLARAIGLVRTEPIATGPVSQARGPTYVPGTVPPDPVAGNGFSSPQLRNGRIFGVLGGPTFKLKVWDQPLSPPTDQP